MPPEGVMSYRTPLGSDASDGSPPNGPALAMLHFWTKWPEAVAPGDRLTASVPMPTTAVTRAALVGRRRAMLTPGLTASGAAGAPTWRRLLQTAAHSCPGHLAVTYGRLSVDSP